jgi:hypothetical protein
VTDLASIPERVLDLCINTLRQANTQACFADPYLEYRNDLAILSAAQTGELLLKAIIAKEHPLLIFRDLPTLEDTNIDEIELSRVIEKGRTHDYVQLPKLLWVVTGRKVPNQELYKKVGQLRNAVQHFCVPDGVDLSHWARRYIYEIVDPLLYENFSLHAIEYHDDISIGYDYVVACLLKSELTFTVPTDFKVTEISIEEHLIESSSAYRNEMEERFKAAGLSLL